MHERVQSSPGTTTPDIRPQHGRPADPFNSPAISLVGERGMRPYRRTSLTSITTTSAAETKFVEDQAAPRATMLTRLAVCSSGSTESTVFCSISPQAITQIEEMLEGQGFKKE